MERSCGSGRGGAWLGGWSLTILQAFFTLPHIDVLEDVCFVFTTFLKTWLAAQIPLLYVLACCLIMFC